MNKEINVSFISYKLKEQFEELQRGKKKEQQLYKFINYAVAKFIQNPSCGIKIQRKLWPKGYYKSFNITNLWKYNLPNAKRLIYTIKTDEKEVIVAILEWLTHKEYEKRFNY